MKHLTKADFLTQIFNFEAEKEWKYLGNKPAIIDFYAAWCGPCKMLAPILEELSKEYEGKLDIFKIDTEAEQELAQAFGIESIPTILFIPQNDVPTMAKGLLPKQELKRVIKETLKIE